MTQPNHDLGTISAAHLRLREITERKGQKITTRDVATAHLARSVIEHLNHKAEDLMKSYSGQLHDSVGRGIQLDAVREMLAEIREILE